jgi:hypothetical protein
MALFDRMRNMTPEKKQKWANALFLLGGGIQGKDITQQAMMLKQMEAMNKAEAKKKNYELSIDNDPTLNPQQKVLMKNYPELGAKYKFESMFPTPTKPPTSYDEFLKAQGSPEYAEFLAKKRPGGTNITLNTGGQEGFASGVSDTYTTAMEGSDGAFNTMGILDNMNSILDTGIKTGGGQEALLGFKQFIQTVDEDLVDSDALANAENFQSASLLYLTPKVKQLGTNPTDADLKLFKDALPTLGKSVAGNRLIIDTLKLSEQRKINEAEFIENWLRDNTELVKSDAFIANLDLNKALRAYRRSDAYRMPAEQLKARRREILRQQRLIDKGELTAISLGDAPFAN